MYDSKVYPPILRGYKRPWCIMAHAPKVSNFDRVMARGFWAKSLGHGLDTIMTTAATPGGYSCQDDDTAGAWLPQYSCRKFASFNWCTHDFYGINVRFRCPVSCGLTKSNPKCNGTSTGVVTAARRSTHMFENGPCDHGRCTRNTSAPLFLHTQSHFFSPPLLSLVNPPAPCRTDHHG